MDADDDGILKEDDCDDRDPTSTILSEDFNCDGNIEVLCANGITYEIEDADCDGFKSFDYDGEDCDDECC